MARLKLNKEEITTIQQLQQKNRDILFQLGDVEAGFRNLQKTKDQLFELWDQLMEEDKQFGEAINKKYGKGTIDFERSCHRRVILT